MVDDIVFSYINNKIDALAARTERVEQASLKMFAYMYSTTNEIKETAGSNKHDDVTAAEVEALKAQNEVLRNQVNELTVTVSALNEKIGKCNIVSGDYILLKRQNSFRDKMYELFHPKQIRAEKQRLEADRINNERMQLENERMRIENARIEKENAELERKKREESAARERAEKRKKIQQLLG